MEFKSETESLNLCVVFASSVSKPRFFKNVKIWILRNSFKNHKCYCKILQLVVTELRKFDIFGRITSCKKEWLIYM